MGGGFEEETWCGSKPPTEGTEVAGKWFDIVYKGKKALFGAKINK